MSGLMTQVHWERPDKLRIKREPGWAYRYIRKADVERRIDEGWEIVESKIRQAKPEAGPVEKAQHYRGLILMRMPQAMADERNAHYKGKHDRRLRAVARGGRMTAVHRAETSEGGVTEGGSPLAGTIGRGLQAKTTTVTEDGLVHTDNIDIPVASNQEELDEDQQSMEELEQRKRSTEELEAPEKISGLKKKPKRR